MHILFLTDNFPPEVNAPASRTFEHCRAWVLAGHSVTVITCVPNFPTGKVFKGYKNRLWRRETVDGLTVIRVWSYISANEGFLRRTLDYVSYMVSAILASPFIRDVDVVVATSPHFFTACAGYVAAVMHQRPFVFELRDLWPESIRAVGAMRDGWVLRLLERLELFLYRRAAAVVSVTHSFKSNLVARGIDGDKIFVVTNGADLTRFGPRSRDVKVARQLGLEQGAFVAGYVGTHGMAHGLETLLEAARLLQDQAAGARVRILFLGDGAAKSSLKVHADALGLKNVLFVDTVPRDEVARYWSLLDVSIIHLKRDELFTTVIPSKLFECMAMGIPVLHGVAGESALIVEREQVGIVFEPENAEQLAMSILDLERADNVRAAYAARGVQAARSYNRDDLAASMLRALQSVVDDSGAERRAGIM